MHKILFRCIANAALLYIAARLIPSLYFADLWAYLIAGIVLGLVNLLVRPVILLLTLPLNLLTLGLFTLIVNAWMLMLTDWLLDSIGLGNFWTSLATAVLLGVGNLLISPFRPK